MAHDAISCSVARASIRSQWCVGAGQATERAKTAWCCELASENGFKFEAGALLKGISAAHFNTHKVRPGPLPSLSGPCAVMAAGS